MPSDSENDRTDLRDLQQGIDIALNHIISRWQERLHGFAFRYVQNAADARELVAETFVRLYQKRNQLRPDSNLSAWLFTTLANLCRNRNRWFRRHPTVRLDQEPHEGSRPIPIPADTAIGPDQYAQQAEQLRLLKEAIDRLPHDLKTALLLHHYERLSYQDIAGIVGCSVRGVETRLYRARQRLRKELSSVLNETAPCP